MIFYSQKGEDEFIYKNLIKGRSINNPTFLEMGALDGVKYSNTKFFEDYLGWRGVLIEPHPLEFEKLQKNRPKCTNYKNLISNSKGKLEYVFYENHSLSAVSGISDTITNKNKEKFFNNQDDWFKKMRKDFLKKEKIEAVTLDHILSKSGLKNLTLFSLDVEGHELSVLESFSFNIPIGIFLIENSPDREKIESLLSKNGYKYFSEVAHNFIYTSGKFF